MQPLPKKFLEKVADEYGLRDTQKKALIQRLCHGSKRSSAVQDAAALNITESALSSRMNGIYTKFSVGGDGPGKLRELHDRLLARYQRESPDSQSSEEEDALDVDLLVAEIRQQVKADIQHRCGTMRVLDMTQPIGIGDIYTSVNILENVLGRQRSDIAALMKDCDIRDFDRFTLGQVRQERVPGLEAVEKYDRLMILGKPGAGKTTFMKRLAVLCNQGKFQPERVPVFVTLKEFAEAEGHPTLLDYIVSQWIAFGVAKDTSFHELLKAGHALVLLDGLDEVQETEHDRVLRCIKGFTQEFHCCQSVMTCRIAAREYTFQQFTEVEIADFNEEQINEFVTKWFVAKEDKKKGQNFIQRLKDNKPIQELATNPLLLTLLCLVFGEAADFPQNRAELYKEGLDVLLKKWDATRNIERDKIYRKLSLKRKEDLLAQIAFSTFKEGDYFFKQRVVEEKIIDYIQNLPGAKEDEEALLIDSEAVLKSIEAQHGLLVERAKYIYSFSHLTFQEYFTAKQITSPSAQMQIQLQALSANVTEKRYREIFLLSVGMLPQANELLLCMKKEIDQIVIGDKNIQQLLIKLQQKTLSINVRYKPAATRAFYFDLALDLDLDFDPDRNLNLYFALAPEVDLALTLDLALDLDRALALDLYLFRALHRALELDRVLDLKLNDLDNNFVHNLDRASSLDRADSAKSILQAKLEKLKQQLPDYRQIEDFKRWWEHYGKDWTDILKRIAVEHRKIYHDWQFTSEQKETLKQYYVTNKLLVDCLNSDCYVTKATRQYIEDTLLLPMSEIEKRPFTP